MNEKNQPETPANQQSDRSLKTISFQQLSEGATEVLVEHQGQTYRLRLTRNGKLILNK